MTSDGSQGFLGRPHVNYEWCFSEKVSTSEFDFDNKFHVFLRVARLPPLPMVDIAVTGMDLTVPCNVHISLTFTLPKGKTHQVANTLNMRPGPTSSASISIGVPPSVLSSKSCVVDFEAGLQSGLMRHPNCVGLLNQGATCYLNVVVQILFHIPKVREVIYGIDSSSSKPPEQNVVLNLQALFAKLETSTEACSTQNLTNSFGWKGTDTMVQHDVQEFWDVLLSNLEGKARVGTIDSLFKGRYRSYMRGKNAAFHTDRVEEFHELSLDVKDCSHIFESFQRYLEPEELVGENQYCDEFYGRQDAVMGVDFLELPPVMALHLRRFEYNIQTGKLVKVRSRFGFPKDLDLAPVCRSIPSQALYYQLYAVVVHTGNPESGHYTLYLRPQLGEQWLEFNDSIVTPVSEDKAIRDNFGSEGHGASTATMAKLRSAYMLVYVRRSDVHSLFNLIPPPTVPREVQEYLATEDEREQQRERQRIENANNHYFAVVTDALMEHKAQLSRLTLPCGGDETTPQYVLIKKTDKCSAMYTAVADKLSIPITSFRLFFVPSKRSTPVEEVPNDEVRYVSDFTGEPGILFVFDNRYSYSSADLEAMSSDEDESEEQSFSFYREPENEGTTFVFIYAYFPGSASHPIHFCAPAVLRWKQEMRELGNIFRCRYGLGSNEKVNIYKITNERLDPINKKARFSAVQTTESGQFLVEVVDSTVCPSEYRLIPLDHDDEPEKSISYMEVVGYPPTCPQYLQWFKSQKEVWVHAFGLKRAVTVPLEISPSDMASFILNHVFKNQTYDPDLKPVLFANYTSRPMRFHGLADSARKTMSPCEELLDIWLDFCQAVNKRTLRIVAWVAHDAVFLDQTEPFTEVVTTKAMAIDVKRMIAARFPQFENRLDEMRVLSVDGYEIVRVVSDYESVVDVVNPLRVEITPPSQKDIDPSTMISVALQNKPSDDFICFLLDLRRGETLAEMKQRILAKVYPRLSVHCMDGCEFRIEPWCQNKQRVLRESDVVDALIDPSKHEHLVIKERELDFMEQYSPRSETLKIYN